MSIVPIHEIQGPGVRSPLAGRRVRTRGVVTGQTGRGFFIQGEAGPLDSSSGLFVFAKRDRPRYRSVVEVEGEVFDYVAQADDKPTTQLLVRRVRVLGGRADLPPPVPIDGRFLDCDNRELARRLDRLEGMRVSIAAGSTFLAPSNPFGDYVVCRRTSRRCARRTEAPASTGAAAPLVPELSVAAPARPAGGRRQHAARGGRRPAELPQLGLPGRGLRPPRRERRTARENVATLRGDDRHLTLLTLNGFNLDPHVEDPSRVQSPRLDVSDDVGDGRYDALAETIVSGAHAPDIVALQEIQDDDGAEMTKVVTAEKNYETILAAIRRAGGPKYGWLDIPRSRARTEASRAATSATPTSYRPDRVEPVSGSLRRIGDGDEAFEDSRKALLARFRFRPTGREIAVVNVHLASKRHQHPIFAPVEPEVDPRGRHAGEAGIDHPRRAAETGGDWYVTGDFNDYEFSRTLKALSDGATNLVELLPEDERYDYNHRGTSQALMHAVVPREMVAADRARYEILHGNELKGVTPGRMGERPTDHGYVLGRVRMAD